MKPALNSRQRAARDKVLEILRANKGELVPLNDLAYKCDFPKPRLVYLLKQSSGVERCYKRADGWRRVTYYWLKDA